MSTIAYVTVAARADHALVLPILLTAAFSNKETNDAAKHITVPCEDASTVGPETEKAIISF